MYPCCILIALILLYIWGAQDRANAVKDYIRYKLTGEPASEDFSQKTLREVLDEAKRENAVFKKNKEGYTDGRTKIVHLREDQNGGPGNEEAQT